LLGFKRHFNHARLVGLGRLEYLDLARKFGIIDQGFNMEKREVQDFFLGTRMPDILGRPEGALLWLKDAERQANLINSCTRFPAIVIDPFQSNGLHIAGYYCSVLESYFDIKYPSDLTDLFPGWTKRGNVGSLALIHPGSGSQAKQFSPGFYQRIKPALISCGFKTVKFILGPAEISIQQNLFSAEDILQPVSVLELSEWLSRASLYIGNDSGVSHLAGFMGVPAIIFYRTTDPAIWGALGKMVHPIICDDELMACQLFRDFFTHSDLKAK
jgi:hypothetical protein